MISLPDVTQIVPYVVATSAVFSILTLVYVILTARQRRQVTDSVNSAIRLVLLLQKLTRNIIERISDYERQMGSIEVRKYDDAQLEIIFSAFKALGKFQQEVLETRENMKRIMTKNSLIGFVDLQSELDFRINEIQLKVDNFAAWVEKRELELKLAQTSGAAENEHGGNHG